MTYMTVNLGSSHLKSLEIKRIKLRMRRTDEMFKEHYLIHVGVRTKKYIISIITGIIIINNYYSN